MMIGARKHQSVIVGMVTLTIYSVENSIRRKCESEQNCWKIVRKGRWKGRKEEVWNYLRSLTHFKVSIFNFMCVEGVFLWRLKSYLKAYVCATLVNSHFMNLLTAQLFLWLGIFVCLFYSKTPWKITIKCWHNKRVSCVVLVTKMLLSQCQNYSELLLLCRSCQNIEKNIKISTYFITWLLHKQKRLSSDWKGTLLNHLLTFS